MRRGNSGTDSCLYGSKIDNSTNGRDSRSPLSKGLGLSWIITIGVVMLVPTRVVFAQFAVQPMRLEVPVRPGKLVKTALEIRSSDPNEVHTVNLSVVHLGQWEDGSWRIIEPNDPNASALIPELPSCREWISVKPQQVVLSPLGVGPVEVSMRVPRGIRGFYAAGIVASVKARPQGPGQVALVVRFLVPVLAEIQGRAAPRRIGITDVGMESIRQFGNNPATTVVSMNVENNGGAYSRLKPMARVWGFMEGHWKVITTAEFDDYSIIPGAKLKLSHDIERSLPRGTYRVVAALYADGRRVKSLEKQMEVAGDPTVAKVATDAPLDLLPPDVIVEGIPGAIRTSAIKVHNASEEVVNVRAALQLPRVLEGVAYGDVKGEDLSCTEWLKVTPENFTLGAYGRQSIQITTTMPNPESTHPCYYALLALWSSYPDGQRAGVATANICVVNKNMQTEPEVMPMRLTLTEVEESRYFVLARFGNFGESGRTIHFKPIGCKAVVATAEGMPIASAQLGAHTSGLMLPFDVRDFSGVMDFAGLPAGTYRCAAALEYAPGVRAENQIAVRVTIEGERRVVDIVQTERELDEIIKVQW